MTSLRLESAVAPGALIVLDSSVVLAYLSGTEAASPAAAIVLDRFVSTGRNEAVLSTITVTESLVRPIRAGSETATGVVEAFLRHFPNLRIEPIGYEIARRAAAIRASTALRTPDALILATAEATGADVVVANDRRWASAIERGGLRVAACYLEEFVSGES